ncbi:MAG: hypothetical protein LBC86_09665 [Oscillospiraceae bacterium]|nr:hypothetical protein [Oscillospiraceae bacterium]
MPTIVTENNADMTVAANVGQITVNIAGAYYISWIVQSDNNSSVSLTINGNSSIKSESGTSLLELKEGDVIGLMNLGIDTLNVTFAQLTVWGLA